MVLLAKLKKWLPLITVVLAIILFPIAELMKNIPLDFGWTLRSLGLFANILLLGGFLVYWKRSKQEFNYDALYQVLLFGAFFIRVSYSYSTGIFLRQHDVSSIDLNDDGHYSYILHLFLTGKLPLTNVYQFYHPPLYHAISAVWLQGVKLLFPAYSVTQLFETLPIMSAITGYFVVYVAYLIVKLKPIYMKRGLPLFLLVAYHPIFILLSGRQNNDNLSILFILLTIYFFMRWRERGKIFNVVGLALAIGLGMMSKLTVAVITPIIGLYMLFDLIKAIRTPAVDPARAWKKQLLELGIFAIIVLPLGLWYPIRNYVLFDQPLGYVFEISNPALSTSMYSFFQRFLPLDFNGLTQSLYARAADDYSIWFYIMKTSVFGEFSYWGAHMYSLFLLIANFVLTGTLGIVFFKRLARIKKNISGYDPLFIGYTLILFIAYVLFNLRYPFGPTMDFRYLIPVIFNGGFLLLVEEKESKLSSFALGGTIAFSAMSLLFFTFLY